MISYFKQARLLFFVFLFFNVLYSKLRIICSAALINDKFELRKNEYIKSLNTLKDFGYNNPYIVEAIKLKGPTFLDNYSKNVYYSKAQDFGIQDIRNKGINEARTLLDAFKHFNFSSNDMILKITGRYCLQSDEFIKLIERNSDTDVFIKYRIVDSLITEKNPQGFWPETGCFAMRCKFFKEMLENLDYKEMEKNYIYLEIKVLEYIKKKLKEKKIKVKFVDKLNLIANIMGDGHYCLMHI